MKLNDLIEALAGEIELVSPELEQGLEALSVLDAEATAFMDALDRYSDQAQRMGEAAEMAGFPGLRAVCAHVVENALLAPSLPAGEARAPLIAFLRKWPPLMVQYLRHIDDPSAAVQMVDHLRCAPNPMDVDQALRVTYKLGAMPLQVALPGESSDGQSTRPVLATPDDVALVVPEDADQKLMEGFFQEAPEHARLLVELVQRMAAGQAQTEDITTAKRVVHTLKGTGAIIGLRGLASLGHHFEDILEHFEVHGAQVDKPVADVLMDAAWCLEQMVAHVTGTDDSPQQAQGVLQNVLDLANRIDRGEDVSQPLYRVGAELVPASAATDAPHMAVAAASASQGERSVGAAQSALRVSMQRIEELFRVSAEVSVHTAAMETRIKLLTLRAKELLEQNLRVQKRLFELETVVDVRALTMMRGRTRRESDAAFDPLEMDQYSELHSTAHALVEEAADARALSHRMEDDIAQLTAMQNRQQLLSRDLQHLVIGTRMAEVGTLETRLQRNIRSTCQATGKQAMLKIKGADTLIDSTVLSRLAEPLLHLLRNAVDHGLETPEERRKAGKPETGSVVLDFSRQGQQVVLRVQDDGRGLDHLAIQKRAIERGLIAADQALSDDEIARLILLQGFSTRDQASEVSGRGVGLDVVRNWVSTSNGSIRISSQPRRGTEVELRFAASLSSVQSLVVEVAGQRFALPSVQIEQAVPRGLGRFEMLAGRLLYRYGTRAIVAHYLAQMVGLPVDAARSMDDYDVVLAHLPDGARAVVVDKLLDARELLVEDPGRYARHVQGVAGLSILGDGGVAVHLDMAQLLDIRTGKVLAPAAAPAQLAGRTAVAALPGVLIVDDSLSVRTSLQELIQDAGFAVQTARDGIDAIDTMRSFSPKVVLTDLEMPNMNGIELTAHIRNREDMKNLPVIMITSRSQNKHRDLALQAGVNAYITKPYTDGDLLQAIRGAITA